LGRGASNARLAFESQEKRRITAIQTIAVDWLCTERYVACDRERNEAGKFGVLER
jgi:hypothetical protein